jgi:hypothetical protein
MFECSDVPESSKSKAKELLVEQDSSTVSCPAFHWSPAVLVSPVRMFFRAGEAAAPTGEKQV